MSLNQELFDIQLRHYSYLERFKNTEVRSAVRLFVRRNREIRATIEAIGDAGEIRKLNDELKFLESVLEERDARLVEALSGKWEEFATREVSYQLRMIENGIPAQLDLSSPSEAQIATALRRRPFQGRPSLVQGFRDFLGENRARVSGAIRQGYAFGKPTSQIIRELSDLSDMNTKHLSTWVRSGISHMASESRRMVYEANNDIIEKEMWVSTLDGKTTPICQIMDGETRELGESQWSNGEYGEPGEVHFNCRSTSTPIVKDWQSLGLGDLPKGTRASIDGQVPDDLTYEGWLKRQEEKDQIKILGVERTRLFRSGEFTLTEMVRDGRYITLDELMSN